MVEISKDLLHLQLLLLPHLFQLLFMLVLQCLQLQVRLLLWSHLLFLRLEFNVRLWWMCCSNSMCWRSPRGEVLEVLDQLDGGIGWQLDWHLNWNYLRFDAQAMDAFDALELEQVH